MKNVSTQLIKRTTIFNKEIEKIVDKINEDVYIYNPLNYASKMMEAYINEYAIAPTKFLFLGMNPGPYGMAQTGIPFGEINTVKNYLKINEIINTPKREHPYRKIEGLNIERSEVSGLRFWALIEKHFKEAKDMKGIIYVANYCPLLFLSPQKRATNITPDKLSKETRFLLEKVCDKYLFDTIELLKCEKLIGIGKYAQKKLKNDNIPYYSIIHPSPASPIANRGWIEQAEKQLIEIGVLNEILY